MLWICEPKGIPKHHHGYSNDDMVIIALLITGGHQAQTLGFLKIVVYNFKQCLLLWWRLQCLRFRQWTIEGLSEWVEVRFGLYETLL